MYHKCKIKYHYGKNVANSTFRHNIEVRSRWQGLKNVENNTHGSRKTRSAVETKVVFKKKKNTHETGSSEIDNSRGPTKDRRTKEPPLRDDLGTEKPPLRDDLGGQTKPHSGTTNGGETTTSKTTDLRRHGMKLS